MVLLFCRGYNQQIVSSANRADLLQEFTWLTLCCQLHSRVSGSPALEGNPLYYTSSILYRVTFQTDNAIMKPNALTLHLKYLLFYKRHVLILNLRRKLSAIVWARDLFFVFCLFIVFIFFLIWTWGGVVLLIWDFFHLLVLTCLRTQSAGDVEIRRLHLCRGIIPLDIVNVTLKKHLIVRFSSRSFKKCEVPFHYYYSQVHSDPKRWYLLESYPWVK